jgi:hypothetical protein
MTRSPDPLTSAEEALLAASRVRGLLPHLAGLIDDQSSLDLQKGLDVLRRHLADVVAEEAIRRRKLEEPAPPVPSEVTLFHHGAVLAERWTSGGLEGEDSVAHRDGQGPRPRGRAQPPVR